MEKHYLTLIFISFLLFLACTSIKKNLSTSNQKKLNRIVDSMYTLDRDNRLNLISLDSIYNVKWDATEVVITRDELRKKIGPKYDAYKKSQDSIWDIIQKTDNTNTELLITLTKKYGFPSKKRLNVYRASAYLIFVHAPKKYHKELKDLINKEYKKERISEYEMAYIFWHLNGRKGMPPRAGKNGSAIYFTNTKNNN